MLNTVIQAGRQQGMQAMDDALFALAKSGRVSPKEAVAKANQKQRFEELLPAEPEP
jgi:Tfp pilus assembly pilus retraction ATPase PilT